MPDVESSALALRADCGAMVSRRYSITTVDLFKIWTDSQAVRQTPHKRFIESSTLSSSTKWSDNLTAEFVATKYPGRYSDGSNPSHSTKKILNLRVIC